MKYDRSETSLESVLTNNPEAVLRLADKLLAEQSLKNFIEVFWHIVEPSRKLIDGWVIDAICEHMEAIAFGEITRLAISVPPGHMKSLITSVFYPAWVWGPLGEPSTRFMCLSYSNKLTQRDNLRFKNVVESQLYRGLWGDVWQVSKDKWTATEMANTKTGFKLASSVGGGVTGHRADSIIVDDPNNIRDVESDLIRNSTNQWFREVLPTRINDAEKSTITVIQQRTHQDDVTGIILDPENGFSDQYTYLMVPMCYDSRRHCRTYLGDRIWDDPRGLDEHGQLLEGDELDEADGELAWPERFPATWVREQEKALGPYAFASQMQQLPSPRGGSIFKLEWWQDWPPGDFTSKTELPDFDYVIASLDPAYTEDKANDFSALTIWGIWRSVNTGWIPPRQISSHEGLIRVRDAETPRVMLMYGWQKRLELHGPPEDRPPGLTDKQWNSQAWLERRQGSWGLVEWVVYTCRKHSVDTLLVENKASGQTVTSELRRLFADEPWSVIEVNPGNQDKVARAHSVVHLFSNGVVYAPWIEPDGYEWCEMIKDAMANFPRGKHNDLVDSAVYALAHLRDMRWALRREESERDFQDSLSMPTRMAPLYPA